VFVLRSLVVIVTGEKFCFVLDCCGNDRGRTPNQPLSVYKEDVWFKYKADVVQRGRMNLPCQNVYKDHNILGTGH
jgi:hypothetical protein